LNVKIKKFEKKWYFVQLFHNNSLILNFFYIIWVKMKQVKYCMSEGKANKWLKENQDKKILDIQMSAGGFAIIYEE